MSKEKKSFLIVGLGRFGSSLCEKLVELGQSVIGVDQLAGPVSEMSDKIDVAAQLDVTDESALTKIGAKEVDIAIVTIGSSLENSVLCTSILVDLQVPLVVARANTALHAKILARVGAHRIVFPEWDMGHKIAENLVYPWYSGFSKIDGGDFCFGKMRPLPEMIGRRRGRGRLPGPEGEQALQVQAGFARRRKQLGSGKQRARAERPRRRLPARCSARPGCHPV